MTGRLVLRFLSPVVAFAPGTASAQTPACADCAPTTGHHAKHHAPPPPADWQYYDLPGGPRLTYCYPFVGWPGYTGAFGHLFPGNKHHPHLQVPVYTPLPAVFSDAALVHPHNVRARTGLGLGYYGWVGPYAASPRPKPVTVSVWPPSAGYAAVPVPTDCLTVTVRVPADAAEVFVEGVKTAQTGTDRRFESPPLEAGKAYRYELVARWVEGGKPVERTATVSGKAGEAVRVDFAEPNPVVTAAGW